MAWRITVTRHGHDEVYEHFITPECTFLETQEDALRWVREHILDGAKVTVEPQREAF